MLTKKQKLKLILMTNHPKYGQLLADTINTWSIEEIKPVRRSMGIDFSNIKYYNLYRNECCLQGASLYLKEVETTDLKTACPYTDVMKFYNLYDEEAHNMRRGFDGLAKLHAWDGSDAYEFGQKVAQ